MVLVASGLQQGKCWGQEVEGEFANGQQVF